MHNIITQGLEFAVEDLLTLEKSMNEQMVASNKLNVNMCIAILQMLGVCLEKSPNLMSYLESSGLLLGLLCEWTVQ